MALKIPPYPNSAEREYNRMLQTYVKDITWFDRRFADLKLDGQVTNDGFSEDLTALLSELISYGLSAANSLIFRLPSVYAQISTWNDRQWVLAVKAGTGIQLPQSGAIPSGMVAYGSVSNPNDIRARFGIGVDVYRAEPWLRPRMNNWIDYNSSLIKSIPTQHFAKVEATIRQGVMAGTSGRELAKQIKAISGVTSNRAKLIAVDQIAKANAELTQYRQQDIGIKRYKWLTSGDERVRPTHVANANKVFKWSEPPSVTGHPGAEIRCRCTALAVFDD